MRPPVLNSRIEILDHTADVGIRVWASSLGELLVLAAQAMMQLVVDETPQDCGVSYTVEISGDDQEQLLVNWLSELNYLLQTERFLFADCQEATLTANRFCSQVVGERLHPGQKHLRSEIKAVTYHQIQIRCNAEGVWQAQVYFDV